MKDKIFAHIYEVVKKIPKGRVATYGQIAELAGKYAFGGAAEQAKLLKSEGIEIVDGRVDLKKYRWENSEDAIG